MDTNNDKAQKQRDIFARNFKQILIVRGKNQADVSTDLGITSSTVSDWANAKKYPRVDKMQTLADYLDVLMSDLRDEKSTIVTDDGLWKQLASDPRKLMLAKWILSLDNQGLNKVEKILDIVETKAKE